MLFIRPPLYSGNTFSRWIDGILFRFSLSLSLCISVRFGHRDVSDRTRRQGSLNLACLLAFEAYGFLFFYLRQEFRWREENEFLNRYVVFCYFFPSLFLFRREERGIFLMVRFEVFVFDLVRFV